MSTEKQAINTEKQGQFFRTMWIKGILAYYPGTPKPGYIAPWEDMPAWEQKAAIAVYAKVRAFILAGGHVSLEQGGRFLAEAWIVQVYRHIESPKPGYVADWDDLPEWQRSTDIDIFSAIEANISRDVIA